MLALSTIALESLLVGNQPLNCRGVGLVERARLAEPAFASAALAREQMAQEGALVLDLAVLAELEALGGAAIGFDLRHTAVRSLLFLIKASPQRGSLTPSFLPTRHQIETRSAVVPATTLAIVIKPRLITGPRLTSR